MRAIRARYDPYLQTRHRVEQVHFYSEREAYCVWDGNDNNALHCPRWCMGWVVMSSTSSKWKPIASSIPQLSLEVGEDSD